MEKMKDSAYINREHNNTCERHLERKQNYMQASYVTLRQIFMLLGAAFHIVDYNVSLRKMKSTRTMLRIFKTKKIVAYKHALYRPLANGR
ncbi:hypothetical protein ACJIZ3_003624 [Penstemon smallii]|uniref:Transposase n=1 Tax=Penstemon smallii TaxID=265156 RepID=A0ABD3UBC3_9LAMI